MVSGKIMVFVSTWVMGSSPLLFRSASVFVGDGFFPVKIDVIVFFKFGMDT